MSPHRPRHLLWQLRVERLGLLLVGGLSCCAGGSDDTATDSVGDSAAATIASGPGCGPLEGQDTGITPFLSGHVQTTDGALTGGTFGLQFLRVGVLPAIESVCDVLGTVTEGPALPPCADCAWSFSLEVSGSTVSGEGCDTFNVSDGMMDGVMELPAAGWGWSEHYAYLYGQDVLDLTNVVWFYWADTGAWYPGAFTYAGKPFGGYVSGEPTDLVWEVPADWCYYYNYP